eukprot:CAMPEP_0119008164 /NCGR_PEP_ID=MMETSP1176-20130426/3510_1 /TAXON_ID=265551 /ORGANISM="Synedropsis recta cf, Strain CCMP1620" /LENGTH=93 /DNA_ID=CAMNT_0006960447 /DNA_START=722 /DNA_END=999 /DNA_ORIENTATION=-
MMIKSKQIYPKVSDRGEVPYEHTNMYHPFMSSSSTITASLFDISTIYLVAGSEETVRDQKISFYEIDSTGTAVPSEVIRHLKSSADREMKMKA